MTNSLPSPDLNLSDTASQPDEQLVANPKTSAATQPSKDLKTAEVYPEHQMATPESGTADRSQMTGIDTRTKISKLLKDRAQEWTAVVERRKGPLHLLDLPMDVLKEIVKEVTHTNDLTALALTHSALHNLAIPHIYSRFDIVWPDAHATTDPRTGVDALTYGLATLCMGDVFTSHNQQQSFTCTSCGTLNTADCNHGQKFGLQLQQGRRRLGNQYPQFTRKFSLGNGPADWVQEYLITKESGKMLGTLVALAVARMVNLETFVWDMPTGVLRDVWLALSSLQGRKLGEECRLERVWVRWHDNSEMSSISPNQNSNPAASTTPQMMAGSTMTPVGWNIPSGSASSSHSHLISYAHSRVEYPTLSVLPPLKSLSVLDIDELDYLDEMSTLIANSKDRLRELRVGLSTKATTRDFAIAWDGPDLQQVDHKAQWPGASTIGERRLGGVLGVLLGRVFDIRKKPKPKPVKREWNTSMASSTPIPAEGQQMQAQILSPLDAPTGEFIQTQLLDNPQNDVLEEDAIGKVDTIASEATSVHSGVPFTTNTLSPNLGDALGLNPHTQSVLADSAQSDIDSLTALIAAHDQVASLPHSPAASPLEIPTALPLRRSKTSSQRQSHFSETPAAERERLEGKLKLQTLELERIPLSIAVLQRAFDWSVLTNLTILDCPQHDRLWVMLRRHFQPSPIGGHHSSSKHVSAGSLLYHLNLKKVHTDAASPALVSFLKETLAPNTLETLFLQDRKRSSNPGVTIDALYRGPLKRHHASLRKLMIDSSDRIPKGPTTVPDSTRWRSWMLSRDVLNYITSGRMSSLRELSVAIDYKDWHHFLQRLPQIPHLRSLNIPFIADYVTPAFEPRELVLQAIDVIVLRPEVELCYMGISHKCYEILESRAHDDTHISADTHASTANGGAGGAMTDDEEEEDDDDDDGSDEEEEEEDDNGTAIGGPIGVDPDETESEMSDQDDSDTDSYDEGEDERSKVRLRPREILFYDDKVAIFKARHGRL